MLRNAGHAGLSEEPDAITNGRNSGYMAMHIAYSAGAGRIVLLGYDMQPDPGGRMHWFGDHPQITPASVCATWRAHFPDLARQLEKKGVEVINCSPMTALECFRKAPIESVLHDPAGAAVPARGI